MSDDDFIIEALADQWVMGGAADGQLGIEGAETLLAAHDERVRADAWSEGHEAGMDDVWKIEREGQSGYTANPYLAAPTPEPTPQPNQEEQA